MSDYKKAAALVILPMLIGGLIGWGVVSNQVESIKEQQRLDALTLDKVLIMETTLSFLNQSQERLIVKVDAYDERLKGLENGDAGNAQILKGLMKAIEELNENIVLSRGELGNIKGDLIRLDEKVKDLGG